MRRLKNTRAEAIAAAICMRVFLQMRKTSDCDCFIRTFARGFQSGVRTMVKALPLARREAVRAARWMRLLEETNRVLKRFEKGRS